MKKKLIYLVLGLMVAEIASVSAAEEPQAMDYTLSMAGALINDHCGRNWQDTDYISIHACNYQLANRYTLAISTQHFEECRVLARGDIIMIADCMTDRFNSWIAQELQKANISSPQ